MLSILQSKPAVFSAVPWNRPRMTICMLTEFMSRADCTRPSVADCLGPLFCRLKYENVESKRQIMEPRAREQTVWFFFLCCYPSGGDDYRNEKRSPSPRQSSWPYDKISAMKWCCFPTASCLSLIHLDQKETPLPTPNTRQSERGGAALTRERRHKKRQGRNVLCYLEKVIAGLAKHSPQPSEDWGIRSMRRGKSCVR